MAASADAQITLMEPDHTVEWPMTASTTLYKGAIVEKVIGNAAAFVLSDRRDRSQVGLMTEATKTCSSTAGSSTVEVRRGKFMLQVTLTNVNEYLVGAYVYLVDDNTFTLGTTRRPIGRVMQYVTTNTAIIEVDTNLCRENMQGGYFNNMRTLTKDHWTLTSVNGPGAWTGLVEESEGGWSITTDTAENDGESIQLLGEHFHFTAYKPVVFGARISTADATECDLLMGICITDTAMLGGLSDGVYIEKLDGSTDVDVTVEKGSAETGSATAVHTLVNSTAVDLSFVYDGSAKVIPYVNGVAGTALAVTNLPDDEALTPSLEFLAGEGAAKVLKIYYMDAYIVG